MAAKSYAGWIILAAALAVPSFLFYKWWSHLNRESSKQMSVKVRNRLPPGTPMFGQPSPAQEKLTNPISTASPQGAPVAIAAPAAPVAAPPAPAAAAPAPAAVEPAPAASSVARIPEAAAAKASFEVGMIAKVVLARDPMLAPSEIAYLREEEESRRAPIASFAPRARRSRAPEVRLHLQGIVSTAEGDRAIVNGEVVGEGDVVNGAKVVKITSNAVVFLHKNKRFVRGISK